MNKKILLLSCPGLAIWMPRRHNSIPSGGTAIGGALTEAGHQVTYFDLNNVLAKHRLKAFEHSPGPIDEKNTPELYLTEDELNSITIPENIHHSLSTQEYTGRIGHWLSCIVDYITTNVNLNEFDIIANSITLVTGATFLEKGAIGFTLLLDHILKSRSTNNNLVSYVGGRSPLNLSINDQFIYNVLNYDKQYLPNRILGGTGEFIFPRYLELYLEDDINRTTINVHDGNGIFSESETENSFPGTLNIDNHFLILTTGKGKFPIPVLPENYKDSIFHSNYIFPEEFKTKFPELSNLTPKPIIDFRLSEGCTFACHFCTNAKKPFIVQPVDKAVDTFKYFYDNGIPYARLYNADINVSLKWIKELCNKLVQANIKMKWMDSANLNIYDQEMFDGLKEAGCVKLYWGTETSVERLLILNNKYHINHYDISAQHEHEKVLQMSRDAGIWNHANIIYNFPTETDEEFQELIDRLNYRIENRLIHAYLINNFKLYRNTTYFRAPELFDVEIRNRTRHAEIYEYNEIGKIKKTWDQVEESGRIKGAKFYSDVDIIPEVQHDDLLFFALHDCLNGDLEKLFNILHDIHYSNSKIIYHSPGRMWDFLQYYLKRNNTLF